MYLLILREWDKVRVIFKIKDPIFSLFSYACVYVVFI